MYRIGQQDGMNNCVRVFITTNRNVCVHTGIRFIIPNHATLICNAFQGVGRVIRTNLVALDEFNPVVDTPSKYHWLQIS